MAMAMALALAMANMDFKSKAQTALAKAVTKMKYKYDYFTTTNPDEALPQMVREGWEPISISTCTYPPTHDERIWYSFLIRKPAAENVENLKPYTRNIMNEFKKQYLGDSVYASIENGMIKLTTENGMGASNEVYLEMEVYDALKTYVEAAVKFYEEQYERHT
jgi:hypothetical protein